MNILVINLGLLLIAATQTYEHWDDVKRVLSAFRQWAINQPPTVLFAYCGLMVWAGWMVWVIGESWV